MATPLPFYGHLGPMQRRLGAIVLGSQVPVIALGALGIRGLAVAGDDPRATMFLVVGFALALLAALAAGLLRRPFGVALGWAVQILCFATAVLAPMIVLVSGLFIALWATALVQGHKMDRLTQAHHDSAAP